MTDKRIRLLADFSMVFVTLVWGATFVTVQEAIRRIEPYYFLAIRFTLAALIMAAASNRRLLRLNLRNTGAAVLTGLMLFSGYAFQTFGLKYTTASNAGFITGLSVVLVPLFLTVLTKKLPRLVSLAGVVSATLGLALLTISEDLTFNAGDFLVFFCAVSFALHILLTGKFSPGIDPFIFSTVQIGTVAVLSFGTAMFKETAPSPASFTPEVWSALLITAVLATAVAFFVQTWSQKFASPSHTAIIFTMEPVFAAVFAYFLGGETFTLRQGLGALFILAGMLSSELGGSEPPKNVPDRSAPCERLPDPNPQIQNVMAEKN